MYRSECYCGNYIPNRVNREDEDNHPSSCCSWTCSGQLNQTCGGDLCNSIYAVNITIRKSLSKGSRSHSEQKLILIYLSM